MAFRLCRMAEAFQRSGEGFPPRENAFSSRKSHLSAEEIHLPVEKNELSPKENHFSPEKNHFSAEVNHLSPEKIHFPAEKNRFQPVGTPIKHAKIGKNSAFLPPNGLRRSLSGQKQTIGATAQLGGDGVEGTAQHHGKGRAPGGTERESFKKEWKNTKSSKDYAKSNKNPA